MAIAAQQPKKPVEEVKKPVEEVKKPVEEKPTQMAQVSTETQALSNELSEGESISTDDLEAQAAQLVQQASAVMGPSTPESPPDDSKAQIA